MDDAGRSQYYPAGRACTGTGCNIVVGAVFQGNVWFSAVSGSRSVSHLNVGYINAKTGRVTKFSVAVKQTQLAGEIVIGPDKNLWFADGSNIGRVTPKGVVTLFPISYNTDAEEIIVGPDSDLWYSNPNNIFVGRISASGHLLGTFYIKNGYIRQLALGADNHVWLSEAQALIRMTSPKTYQTYPIKQKGGVECQPRGFAIGGDGNLWFSESGYSTSGTCSLGLGTVTPGK
jgi:streptogramin lyase